MDDIAERLQRVVEAHGNEALDVATSAWNTRTDNGVGCRIMHLLGSPNWISGVVLCVSNTAEINRIVYGWFPYPYFTKTNCIVFFGHNLKPHSWTHVYNAIVQAQGRGAKLIVLDPHRSESTERADIRLPLKLRTDAALMFG